ncbi:ABC1 kinase family protein [Kineosporia succinea]|uniref:Unusual protein kinase regulating ubiquinone biosynthesis (AarF/ABC1/UbiB family) n=1 Tax=Kineosporia succinea TaxID=84632 RepID=A0ABT9NZX1_9ACTN|nr:AarF/ABC1/UbiB kinase family protein [Kineosporia succinea]MDP9825983.1 putative unusual protein kinase regulating ubiquinone biosynthesis (AarF/ABC1/UbiB family) [Kineosporia succinea]
MTTGGDSRQDAGRIRTGRVARAAPLVALTGRTAGEAVISALRRKDRAGVRQRGAERYAESLGRSRGVLMKAGQILSFVSLGSMVEGSSQSVYQAALARLQDDAPPMEPELAAGVVTAELGAPPHEVFAEFAPHPLAAASIGQVHAATTHDGRRVVVKIQYPGVDEAIRADLANAELLATFFQVIRGVLPDLGRTDARALAAEVTERIGEEIDYLTEASNQQIFADAYRGHPFARVPEVLPEFSTGRVLTMDRSDGLRWAQAREADQELKNQWGEAIYRFTLGSLRRMGRFNADPHPGNYLFHPDGSVTFLDFGCVKSWRDDQVEWMVRAVQAAVEGRADDLLRHYTEQGFVPGEPPDAQAMLVWAREALTPVLGDQPFTYTPEFAARIVDLEFSPRGPHSAVVQKLALPGEYVALTRIDLGLTSVLAGLRAQGDWRSIRDELDLGAEPVTAYGKLEAAYREGLS